MIIKFKLFMILIGSIVLGACNVNESVSNEDNDNPNIDYLWVYQQTHLQSESKTFVNYCEKQLDNVREDGLSEDESDDNGIVIYNALILNSDLDYNFKWKIKNDKVIVNANCKIVGQVQENVFRHVDFKVRNYNTNYKLNMK